MTGALPHWMETWLGIPQAGPGEGAAWSLDHSWRWAPWATVLLLLAAAAWIGWCYAREPGGAGRWTRIVLAAMRLMLVVLVLFMLAGFVLSLHRTGLPYVVVLVDDSASMGLVDQYDDQALQELMTEKLRAVKLDRASRLNLAKSLLLEDRGRWLREIESRYKLRVYFVASSARQQSGDSAQLASDVRRMDATGHSSRLGEALETVLNDLRGTPPSAIVLLTDGITTEGATLTEAAAQARRKGVPLFTVALGSEKPSRDLELSDLLVDEVVFADDVVNFEFKFTSAGYEGQKFKIRLRDKTQTSPLAEITVTAGADGEPQQVRLPYRPRKVGDFDYVVEVDAQPLETRPENNHQERRVSVRKEQVRVLLVQSYPNYEFRYLKHMLERDSTIELKTVLQESDLEYAEQDQSALRVFPVRREELFAFDVVIFGDVNPAFLSPTSLSHLGEFVTEKGGGLVFIAGPRYTPMEYRDSPLAALMPIDFNGASGPDPGQVITEPIQPEPTDLGLASPAMQLGDNPLETAEIWRRLPPVYWFFEAPTLKPAARVLAEHPVRMTPDGRRLPVILMQYVGAGKVLFHATDESWRWRFRVGDLYFGRYWVQSLRYLSRAKLLGKDRSAELTVDRREYRRGESVRLRVRFLDDRQAPADDDGVTVLLERQGDKNRRVRLRRSSGNRGVFEATFGKPLEGSYHAWVATPTLPGDPPAADFLVVAPPGEMAQIRTDTGELKRASQETKGRFYTLATASALLGDLPEGRQVRTDPLPPVVLWNQWPVLLLFLILLVGEWVLRKRGGML